MVRHLLQHMQGGLPASTTGGRSVSASPGGCDGPAALQAAALSGAADVCVQDSVKHSALEAACRHSLELVQLLLALDGPLQMHSLESPATGAFLAAAANPDVHVLQALLQIDSEAPFNHNFRIQAFAVACKQGTVAHVEAFLALTGARRIRSARDFFSGFLGACGGGNIPVVRFMLTLRGDQRVAIGDGRGQVMPACCRQKSEETSLELLQLVLHNATELTFPLMTAGMPAMLACATWGNFKSLQHLLAFYSQKGCDVRCAVLRLSLTASLGVMPYIASVYGIWSIPQILCGMYRSVRHDVSPRAAAATALQCMVQDMHSKGTNNQQFDQYDSAMLWMLRALYTPLVGQRCFASQLIAKSLAGQGWCRFNLEACQGKPQTDGAPSDSIESTIGSGSDEHHLVCVQRDAVRGLVSELVNSAVSGQVRWTGLPPMDETVHYYYDADSEDGCNWERLGRGMLPRRGMLLFRARARGLGRSAEPRVLQSAAP